MGENIPFAKVLGDFQYAVKAFYKTNCPLDIPFEDCKTIGKTEDGLGGSKTTNQKAMKKKLNKHLCKKKKKKTPNMKIDEIKERNENDVYKIIKDYRN